MSEPTRGRTAEVLRFLCPGPEDDAGPEPGTYRCVFAQAAALAGAVAAVLYAPAWGWLDTITVSGLEAVVTLTPDGARAAQTATPEGAERAGMWLATLGGEDEA